MRHSIVKTGMILALTCTAFRVYPESGPQIWSIPIPRFTEDIKKGETSFLASMDPALLDPSHVKNLGPGGGLYLSYIFEKLKKTEEAVLMLETEITNRKAAGDESGGIFLREAAYRLLSLQAAKKSAEALERAEALAVAAVEDRRVFYLLAEGYFKLKRDKDAIRNLDRAVTQRFGILSEEEAARSEFLRAAAGARLGLPGWDRLYLGLFTSQPSSAIIGEAYEFLGREKISLSPFDADEQGFLRARYDTYKQEYHKAQTSFSKLIAKRSAPALSVQGILDAGKAIAGSGESKKGAQALKELGDSLSRSILPEAQLKASAAYRVSGNLSRRLSKYPEAKAAYTEALKGASAQDRDRIVWAMMSCDLSSSPETLVKNLPGYIPLTADPSFFSDILEDLSTALVTKRGFESFPEAFKAIEPWADGETVARYAYITLRAMEEGYIPEKNRKPLLDAVFSRHAKSSSAFYYLFLLSVREEKNPIRFYAEKESKPREESPRSGAEQLCLGFLSFGLRDEAYAAARLMRIN
jgi:tetratricopeptide (TPR) repeat protein